MLFGLRVELVLHVVGTNGNECSFQGLHELNRGSRHLPLSKDRYGLRPILWINYVLFHHLSPVERLV